MILGPNVALCSFSTFQPTYSSSPIAKSARRGSFTPPVHAPESSPTMSPIGGRLMSHHNERTPLSSRAGAGARTNSSRLESSRR